MSFRRFLITRNSSDWNMKGNKNLAGRSRSCRRESTTDFSKSGRTGDEKKALGLACLLELCMIHRRPDSQSDEHRTEPKVQPSQAAPFLQMGWTRRLCLSSAFILYHQVMLEWAIRCLPTRVHRTEVCLAQDSRDLSALVALNFDLAVLHRASRAAGLLHRLGQLLLFRKTDANESLNHRHRLAAAPCLLPDDIHAATIFPRRFGFTGVP